MNKLNNTTQTPAEDAKKIALHHNCKAYKCRHYCALANYGIRWCDVQGKLDDSTEECGQFSEEPEGIATSSESNSIIYYGIDE